MSIKKYLDKSIAELQQELLVMRKEQLGLRLQKQSGQASRPHLLRLLRKNVARVKTLLRTKV
jgi:large subunit ribosomal protein L29